MATTRRERMKTARLSLKEQRGLVAAVNALILSAEDPTMITTNTAMCGRYELETLCRIHKHCWNKLYTPLQPDAALGESKERK